MSWGQQQDQVKGQVRLAHSEVPEKRSQWLSSGPTWLCPGLPSGQGPGAAPAVHRPPRAAAAAASRPVSRSGLVLEVGFDCVLLGQHGPVHHLPESVQPCPLL